MTSLVEQNQNGGEIPTSNFSFLSWLADLRGGGERQQAPQHDQHQARRQLDPHPRRRHHEHRRQLHISGKEHGVVVSLQVGSLVKHLSTYLTEVLGWLFRHILAVLMGRQMELIFALPFEFFPTYLTNPGYLTVLSITDLILPFVPLNNALLVVIFHVHDWNSLTACFGRARCIQRVTLFVHVLDKIFSTVDPFVACHTSKRSLKMFHFFMLKNFVR